MWGDIPYYLTEHWEKGGKTSANIPCGKRGPDGGSWEDRRKKKERAELREIGEKSFRNELARRYEKPLAEDGRRKDVENCPTLSCGPQQDRDKAMNLRKRKGGGRK